jgi:two-component sensor histidine kinase
MDFFVFLSLVTLLLYIQAAIYVWLLLPSSSIKYLFLAVLAAFILHAAFYPVSVFISGAENIYILDRISAVGVLSYPILVLELILRITGLQNSKIKMLIRYLLIPLWSLFLARYWYDPASIKEFYQQNQLWFYNIVMENFWFAGIVLYIGVSAVIGLILLWRWKNQNLSTRQTIISNVLITTLILFMLGHVFSKLFVPVSGILDFLSLPFLNTLPLAAGLFYSLVVLRPKAFSAEVIAGLISNRINDFVFYLDQNGNIYDANRFCLDNLQYSSFELPRTKPQRIFSDHELLARCFDNIHDLVHPPEFQMDLYTKSGMPIPVNLSLVKIEDRYGILLGMVLIGVDYQQKIKLKMEVEERMRNEKKLSNIREELEVMVEKRTRELYEANERLKQEIHERKRAEEQNKADLDEKIKLVQEIHHRVKNNIQIIISLINMLANHKLMSTEGSQTLRDIAERVRNISSIHEDFYDSPNLSRINFSHFLKRTTEEIYRNSRIKRNIIFRLNVSEEYLGIDQAIPCGIIFYELLGNSLKHAFPSGEQKNQMSAFHTINVEFFRKGNEFTLIISDNGVGVAGDFDIQNPKSTGLQLINVLVKQHLKGKIVAQNSYGTTIILKFLV